MGAFLLDILLNILSAVPLAWSPRTRRREHPAAVALAIVLKRRYGPDASNVSGRSVE
jgi:hypothetical protein